MFCVSFWKAVFFFFHFNLTAVWEFHWSCSSREDGFFFAFNQQKLSRNPSNSAFKYFLWDVIILKNYKHSTWNKVIWESKLCTTLTEKQMMNLIFSLYLQGYFKKFMLNVFKVYFGTKHFEIYAYVFKLWSNLVSLSLALTCFGFNLWFWHLTFSWAPLLKTFFPFPFTNTSFTLPILPV